MKALRTATLAALFLGASVVCGCADRIFNYAAEEAIKAVEDHRGNGHNPDSTECDSIGPVHPHCK